MVSQSQSVPPWVIPGLLIIASLSPPLLGGSPFLPPLILGGFPSLTEPMKFGVGGRRGDVLLKQLTRNKLTFHCYLYLEGEGKMVNWHYTTVALVFSL